MAIDNCVISHSRLPYFTDSYFHPLVFAFHDKCYKYERIQQGNLLDIT